MFPCPLHSASGWCNGNIAASLAVAPRSIRGPGSILFLEVHLTATSTLASLLSDLSTIATSVFTWVGTAASTIVETPFLLLTTGFLVVGGAVGILGRLLSRN